MLPLTVTIVALLATVGSGQYSRGRITNSLSDNFEELPPAVPLPQQRGPRQQLQNASTPATTTQPSPPNVEIAVAPSSGPLDRRPPGPPQPGPSPSPSGRGRFPWPDMDRQRCGAWNEWENATCWWPSTSWDELPASCTYLPMPEKLPAVLKSFIESKVKEKYNMIVAEYRKRGSPPVCGYCAKSFACRTRNGTGESENRFRPSFCRKKEIKPVKANCSDSAPCSLTLEEGACPPPMFLDLKRVEKVNKLIALGDDEGTAQALYDMGQPSDQDITSFANMELFGGQREQREQRGRMKRQASYYEPMFNSNQWTNNRDSQYSSYERPQRPSFSGNNFGPNRQNGFSGNNFNDRRRSPEFGQYGQGYTPEFGQYGQGYTPEFGQYGQGYTPEFGQYGQGYNSFGNNQRPIRFNTNTGNYNRGSFGGFDDGYSSYYPRGQEIFTSNWQPPRMQTDNSNRRSFDDYSRYDNGYSSYNPRAFESFSDLWQSPPMMDSFRSFDDWSQQSNNYRARDEPMRFDNNMFRDEMPYFDFRRDQMGGSSGPQNRMQGQDWTRSMRPEGRENRQLGPREDRGRQGPPPPPRDWERNDRSSFESDRRMPFDRREERGRQGPPPPPRNWDRNDRSSFEFDRRMPFDRREERGRQGPPPPPRDWERNDRSSFEFDKRMPFDRREERGRQGPPSPPRDWDRNDRSSPEFDRRMPFDRREERGRQGPPSPPRDWDRNDRSSFEFDRRRMPFGPQERDDPERRFGPGGMDKRRPFEPFGPEKGRRGGRGRGRFDSSSEERGWGPMERHSHHGRPGPFGPRNDFGGQEESFSFDGPFGSRMNREGPGESFGFDGPFDRNNRGNLEDSFGFDGQFDSRRGREGPGRPFGPEGRDRRFGPDGRGGRGRFGPHRRGHSESHEHHGRPGDVRKHHFSFLHELMRGTSCASNGDRCLCCCGHYIPDVNNNTCVDIHTLFKGIDGVYDRLADSLDDTPDMAYDTPMDL